MRIVVKKSVSVSLALLIVLAIILVFAVGTGIAYLWFNRPASAQQKLAESAEQSQDVFKQYRAADYAAARKALLDGIRRLDALNAESSQPNRNPYAVDAMISYVRLAKLEEKNGGTSQAEFMKEASARCRRLGWANTLCSAEKLRQVTDQMDKMGPQEASQ